MTTSDANYRKHNDHSHNSSTYHKKDGTPVRARLKQAAKDEIQEAYQRIDALSERDGTLWQAR